MTAEDKYAEALELYKTTSMTLKEISEKCGVSRNGFACFLQRCHRDLMYRRHGVSAADSCKRMRKGKGQTPASRKKYRKAIEACDSEEYIGLNVSQIARLFNLSDSGLANQLRAHYPEIIERRERERRNRGIADNQHRGARSTAIEAYSAPLQLLKDTDITIEEAADACNVSFSGLRQHILRYHKNLADDRENRRLEGKMHPKIGALGGNGTIRRPGSEEIARYAEAVELYRTTNLPMKEICRRTGHNLSSFRNHMRSWHRDMMFLRRGVTLPESASDRQPLDSVRRADPATRDKYAPAVAMLAEDGKSVESIAREFGFIPEVFRAYLKDHFPELWSRQGMTALADGRKVLRRSYEKYGPAIEIYRTTAESLRSIAARLNLTYNSINSFIRRNMPEVIEEHNSLLAAGQ